MKKTFEKSVDDGQAIYKPWVLKLYDIVVVYISNSFIWRCHRRHIIELYKKHIGAKHLDIGVGSGFYLKKVLSQIKSLDLMDLNADALRYTTNRIAKKDALSIKHNVFEKFPDKCKEYDSLGMNYLLHCIPGTFKGEKGKALENAVDSLKKGGVLFGSTIIKADKNSSYLTHKLMKLYNKKGIFHNMEDTREELEKMLNKNLKLVKTKHIGSVVLFSGIKR